MTRGVGMTWFGVICEQEKNIVPAGSIGAYRLHFRKMTGTARAATVVESRGARGSWYKSV